MNVGALFAAVLPTNILNQPTLDEYGARPWWTESPNMPLWPRFLVWLIRRRTTRRLAGRTSGKLDDWLWKKYFAAIDNNPASNHPSTDTPISANRSHA